MTENIASLVEYKEGQYVGRSLRGDVEWTLPQALQDVQELLDTDQLERQGEAVARRLAGPLRLVTEPRPESRGCADHHAL